MDMPGLETSSWGMPNTEVDVRALRRYQIILISINSFGEYLCFIQLIGILFGTVWLFAQTNFEDVIFYDGTEMTCVFNGETGKITNVQ
jgi:hypothetical protein